jgi:hypothetical protein
MSRDRKQLKDPAGQRSDICGTLPKIKPKTPAGQTREYRRQQIAAGIIAQKPIGAIADEMGLSREWTSKEANRAETQSLIRNLLIPHRKRLERVVDQSIAAVERALVSDQVQREERIAWLKDRIAKLQQVIAERATDPSMQAVPGGKTGTLVRRMKQIGSGPNASMVDEYEVDAGMLKELRAHEEQLAHELNDYTPHLKAVERASTLLGWAEGRTSGSDNISGGGASGAQAGGQMVELLALYQQVTIHGSDRSRRDALDYVAEAGGSPDVPTYRRK